MLSQNGSFNDRKEEHLRGRINYFFESLQKRPVLVSVCVSVLLTLIVEILSRHSFVAGFMFFWWHPLRFVMNTFIIMMTLSASLLFHRRDFFLILISAVWLALGITNYVLLGYRTTPLGMIDFSILKSSIGIIDVYLDLWQIILVVILAVAVILGLLIIFIKAQRHRVKHLKSLLFLGLVAAGFFVTSFMSVDAKDLEDSFSNIADAYEEYGFA